MIFSIICNWQLIKGVSTSVLKVSYNKIIAEQFKQNNTRLLIVNENVHVKS